jgi:predicted permease
MASFYDQLRHTIRRLARSPLFTAITLLTLAITIGANTLVFSVVEGVLLRPLDYPHPEQLIGVWYKAPGVNLPDLNIGPFLYFIDREQNSTFQDVGAYNGDSVSVTGSGQPEQVDGVDVTDGTLPILGVKPVLGRLFTRQDDLPASPKTIILSYGYWQRRFGGSSSVIGRTLTIDGNVRQVIGVLPRDFRFLHYRHADIFLPMQWDRAKTKLGNFSDRALARLKPGVTLNQASADIARLIPVAIRSFPAPDGFSVSLFEKADFQPNLRPLKKDVIGDIGNILWVLMGSIALVLLVACANVANLLLVRVEGRRQELAVRSALGAGRASIIQQILLDSLVLSVAGGVLGIALAFAALRLLVSLAPSELPRLDEIGLHGPVLLFAAAITLFVGLVIGLVPVLKYAGTRLSTGLREGGRALSQSRERHRARKVLVVIQVALALVLLICSSLMIRTFQALVRVSPGFTDPTSLASFRIYIPETQIPDNQGERIVRMEQAIKDHLAALPGVQSVSISTGVPMDGDYSMDPVMSDDRVYKEGELPPLRHFKFVSPGYFQTIGTSLVAGRDLTWAEIYEKRPIALISENFAREYWGSPAAAIGKRIRVGNNDDWREVVGVAHDIYDDGVNKPAPSTVYWPIYGEHFEGQKEMVRRGVNFVLRSPRAGSSAFLHEVQQTVWSVNPDLPLADATTLNELYRKSMARTSFTLVMLCVAGGMALLLGIVGIYGVISYTVSQRTREIGIRMALGAQREALTGMFVRQGLGLTVIGVVTGLLVAAFALRLMTALLFHISPIDPWSYSLATLAITAVAWLACYLPARRASVVNPVHALRAE